MKFQLMLYLSDTTILGRVFDRWEDACAACSKLEQSARINNFPGSYYITIIKEETQNEKERR